ncbi:MAG: hypothetical protein IJE43_24295 [Alphaproteobacteria bacterium]|nr:hypothetical protein [Alphaproteobacteria bacterium]
MSAQFHETVRGRDFYDRDIPNLIQAIKQVAHELQQNTEMQYKIYESTIPKTAVDANDMTIEQLIKVLHTFPANGKVRVLGCNKIYINRCGDDISFDDQPIKGTD